MENTIPTAEEFIEQNYSSIPFELDQITELMQEFTKLHVQAALKMASEKAGVNWEGAGNNLDAYVNKETILEAYPLNNIK